MGKLIVRINNGLVNIIEPVTVCSWTFGWLLIKDTKVTDLMHISQQNLKSSGQSAGKNEKKIHGKVIR